MIEIISEMWRLGLGHYIDSHPEFWPMFWLSFWISAQACSPLLALSIVPLLVPVLDRAVARWRERRDKTPKA